jgi:hypothetical protein
MESSMQPCVIGQQLRVELECLDAYEVVFDAIVVRIPCSELIKFNLYMSRTITKGVLLP